MLNWLPRVEPWVLPDATHLLRVMNPSRNGQRLGRVLVEAFPPHGVNDHRRACDGNGTSRRITLKTSGNT